MRIHGKRLYQQGGKRKSRLWSQNTFCDGRKTGNFTGLFAGCKCSVRYAIRMAGACRAGERSGCRAKENGHLVHRGLDGPRSKTAKTPFVRRFWLMRMRTTASSSPNGKEQGSIRLRSRRQQKPPLVFHILSLLPPCSLPFGSAGMHFLRFPSFSVFLIFFLFVFLQLFPLFSEQKAKAAPFIKTGRPLLYRETLFATCYRSMDKLAAAFKSIEAVLPARNS